MASRSGWSLAPVPWSSISGVGAVLHGRRTRGIDNLLMAYLFRQADSSFAVVVASAGIRASAPRSGFDADITDPPHDVVGNGLTRVHRHNLDWIGLIMGTEDEMSVG